MQRLRSSLQKSGISCNQNCLLCYCTFLLITGKCKLDGLSWVSYNLRICWEFPVYLCWFFISFLTLSTFQSESESHSVVPDSLRPHGLCRPWNSPDQNTGVGSCSLLQGLFPLREQHPGLALQADSLPSESPGKPQKRKSRTNRKLKIHQWSQSL